MADGLRLSIKALGGRLVLVAESSGREVKAPFGGKRPKFVEGQHPRDRHGRFIEIGGTVSMFGGGTGEVLKDVGHGRVEVRSDRDGKVRIVDAGMTTQIRTAAQNANRAGRLDPATANDHHSGGWAAAHGRDDSAAARFGGHVAGAAHDEVSGGPAEAPKGPAGTTHAPDADPHGAISHLATPDGQQAAWLHHDPEGGEPVGHVRTDAADPNTTHRFDSSQQWAAHADAQGMEETDQVPPSPGDHAATGLNGEEDPDPGTAGEAETIPGEPQQGVAAADQVAQFLSDGLDHEVTAYREAGGDAADKPDSATQAETDKAAQQAKVEVAADLTERMAHVPDEEILSPTDLAMLGRLKDGSSVLLRMPYHIAHPGAREKPLIDPANPNPGEELGNWDYREVPTARFDQLMASGHQLPGATERVSAEQWAGWKRNERISNTVALWATQSNGTNPHALALQETAQDLFGIDQAADWGAFADYPDLRDQVDQVKADNRPFHEAFLLAQYDATQDKLRDAGITHVQLFRGFRSYDDSPEWMQSDGVSEVPLRPLSSFSADEKVAASFARDIHGDEGVVISATVPASRVLGTPRSGVGSLSEQEFVVLGGPGQWNVRHTSETDGPALDHDWDPLDFGHGDVFYDENGDPIDAEGHPLPGGGSPTGMSPAESPAQLLGTRDELQRAVQAADTPERRKELTERARKLGMTDVIPDTWQEDGSQGADPNALPTERGPDGKLVPLTPEELAAHTAHVEDAIRQAKADGLETDKMYSLDGKGKVWEPERAKLHNQIVNDVWATATNVPDEGKGLFSGGMGGSGKTTTLKNPKTGIDQSQYLTINPDDIKEIMAARGMVPETPNAPDLSPMEKVALIHEESSHIAGMLALRAYAEKKNCVTPDTPILCADLTWRPAGDLKPGDRIIAFDEYRDVPHPSRPGHTRNDRRYRTAVVEANALDVQTCYRVTTSLGEATASDGHRWLVRRRKFGQAYTYVNGERRPNGQYNNLSWGWVTTTELREGDEIGYFAEPWTADESWWSGWLAGMLDGEGCLHKTAAKTYALSVGQRIGPTLDRLRQEFARLSAKVGDRERAPRGMGKQRFGTLAVQDRRESLRILGTVRPQRLLDTFASQGEIDDAQVARMVDKAVVTAIEPVGQQSVSALQTSTGTYIANGFLSHNCTWDITMASESSVQKRIDAMHAAGYGELKAVFVDIPVEGSVARAMGRYTSGLERYRNGVGEGGRYVPPDVIRENASTSFSSANRKNFEALRDQFDNWQVWDNSVDGRQPRLVYAKGDPNLDALTAQAELGKTDADLGVQAKALPGTAAALDRLRRLARAS